MGRKRNKNVSNDVNAAEVAMEKAVQRVQVILWEHSEQEIRETLLQCNLNHNVAIDRLLSLQDESNKQGGSTQLTDSSTTSSVLVPNQSDLANLETRDVPVPVSSDQVAPSLSEPSSRSVPISSSEAAPSLPVPSSSAITNGVTRSVSTSSNVAVLPSSRALTNVTPMAEAPVKADDSPLKPDATNPIFNSITESDAAARDPQHSAFPMATASPLGPRPMTFMFNDAFGTYPTFVPHNNQQGMNWGQVPSGQYGNMINSPYWRPNQKESYDMAPLQQLGGGSNSNTLARGVITMNSPHSRLEQDHTSIYESLNSVFAPYRNSTLSLSATSSVPTYHGAGMLSGNAAKSRLGYEEVSRNHLPSNSSGTTTGSSSHGSAFDDVTSGNGSNSRFGYEDVSRIHMPSIQGRSPLVWRVQGEDSYRSIRPRSQQEREAYFERIRADLASSTDQAGHNRRNRTQQQPRDK